MLRSIGGTRNDSEIGPCCSRTYVKATAIPIKTMNGTAANKKNLAPRPACLIARRPRVAGTSCQSVVVYWGGAGCPCGGGSRYAWPVGG